MSINSQLASLLSSNGVLTLSNALNSSSPITGALVVSGGVGISGNLYVGGQIISNKGVISNNILTYDTFTVTTTDATIIGNFPISQYRSAKFHIQISDTTPSFQVSEILLLAIAKATTSNTGTPSDTGATSIAEYAILTSDALLGDYSSDVHLDGIVRLYFIPNTATNKTVKVSVQLMAI